MTMLRSRPHWLKKNGNGDGPDLEIVFDVHSVEPSATVEDKTSEVELIKRKPLYFKVVQNKPKDSDIFIGTSGKSSNLRPANKRSLLNADYFKDLCGLQTDIYCRSECKNGGYQFIQRLNLIANQ